MMRLSIFALLLFSVGCAARKPHVYTRLSDPAFAQRLVQFNADFNAFTRAYLGCPYDARTLDDCRPKQGYTDLQAYRRAQDAATKVFAVRKENHDQQ